MGRNILQTLKTRLHHFEITLLYMHVLESETESAQFPTLLKLSNRSVKCKKFASPTIIHSPFRHIQKWLPHLSSLCSLLQPFHNRILFRTGQPSVSCLAVAKQTGCTKEKPLNARDKGRPNLQRQLMENQTRTCSNSAAVLAACRRWLQSWDFYRI